MMRYIVSLLIMLSVGLADSEYIDGILVSTDQIAPASGRQFTVIDSFRSAATNYSMGLAFDGQYLWNNETFFKWFATMDTSDGSTVRTFTPTTGNRDMTFDGQYLWASDWQAASINQYDTSDCSVIATYYPPFTAGKPNGMAWDGTNLWVGEESGRIYQMTTTGDTIRSIPSPYPAAYEPRGLAFDGEYLWVGRQDRPCTIYKIDTITGAIQSSHNAPGSGFQQGLAFDGQYLWSTSGSYNWIYKIDIGLAGIEESKEITQNRITVNSHPNPFKSRTNIVFSVDKPTHVHIFLADATGRFVSQLLDEDITPGTHTVNVERKILKSGIYFAVLETDEGVARTKLIILD